MKNRCKHGKVDVCVYCLQDEINELKKRSNSMGCKCNCNKGPVVKIVKLDEDAILPKYAKDGDAGADIYSIEDTKLFNGDTVVVKTGLSIELPDRHEAQIRSRSGLAAKHGIFVLNSPGTIDCGYRGEICVILHKTSQTMSPFEIKKGDRIAQMVIKPVEQAIFEVTDSLSETQRGTGGFGHTGV